MRGDHTSPGRLRRPLKAVAFCLSWALVAPLVVAVWLEKRLTSSEVLFTGCAQLLALCPGFPGRCLRGAYYFGTLAQCSWETHIGFGSVFTHREAVVNPLVSMGVYCVIGHAYIEQGVRMGSRVSVPSGKRQHVDDNGRLAPVTRFERVAIGRESWIGEGAIILARVGERCIISAGAVVTKEVPSGSLAAGNPARVVREVEAAEAPSAQG